LLPTHFEVLIFSYVDACTAEKSIFITVHIGKQSNKCDSNLPHRKFIDEVHLAESSQDFSEISDPS